MKIRCELDRLRSALKKVSTAVEDNPVIPILGNIRFTVKDQQLTLTGGSMNAYITDSMPVDVKTETQECDVCVPTKIVGFVQRVEGPIVITVDEKFSIKGENSSISVQVEPGKDYPNLPVVKSDPVKVSDPDLGYAIKKLSAGAKHDPARSWGDCLYICPHGDGMSITGGSHACFGSYKSEGLSEEGFLVRNNVYGKLPDLGSDLSISISESSVKIQCGESVVYGPLVDSSMPWNYFSTVVKVEDVKPVVVGKETLWEALGVLSGTLSKADRSVEFKVQGTRLKMIAAQPMSEDFTETEVDVEYQGPDTTFHVNHDYIKLSVGSVTGEEVYIYNHPMYLFVTDNQDWKFLIGKLNQ